MARKALLVTAAAAVLALASPALAGQRSPGGGGGLTIQAACKQVGCQLSVPYVPGATYQWTQGGSAISGATSNTYTPTGPADYGVTQNSAGVTIYGDVTITGTPPATAYLSTNYDFTPTISGGSGSGYVAALTGSFPPGITLASPSTGEFSGVPTQLGTFSGLNETVTDSVGNTASLGAFQITVQNAVNPNCPQGTNWNDGCVNSTASLGTPLMPKFGRSTFFGTTSNGYTADGVARQSGQASSGYAVTVPFNVAGVDFAVGPIVPAGGWLDPDTLAHGPFSAACSWTQLTVPFTVWVMECNHATNLDIENIDFSHTTAFASAAGQDCIPLLIKGNNNGYIRVKNNKFVLGNSCVSGTSTLNYLVEIQNGNWAPVDFEYNYLDGKSRSFPNVELDILAVLSVVPDAADNGGVVDVPGTNFTLVAKYNYLVHVAGRPMSSNTFGNIDVEDNYAEGWALPGTAIGIHGELISNVRNSPTVNETISQWTYINNTMLGDTDMVSGQGATMLWVNTNMGNETTTPGDVVSNLYSQYNVTISNLSGGQGGTIGTGTVGLYIQDTNVTAGYFDHNYMDPGRTTSPPYCYRMTVPYQGTIPDNAWLSPGGSSTNVNLLTGTAQTQWAVDGWTGVTPVSVDCQ